MPSYFATSGSRDAFIRRSLLSFQLLRLNTFGQCLHIFATIGSRDSFIWRSLLAGKALAEDGYFSRVGNGVSIDILCDKWLNKMPPSAAISPTNISLIPLKICELIDNSSRS